MSSELLIALRRWIQWADLYEFDREIMLLVDSGRVRSVGDLYRLDAATVGEGMARALAEHRPVPLEKVVQLLRQPQSAVRSIERAVYRTLGELLDDPEVERRAPELDAKAVRRFADHVREHAPWLASGRLAPLVEMPRKPSLERASRMAATSGQPLSPARRERFGESAARLRERLGFELPDDFFAVYELASEIAPHDPLHAFDDTLSLTLAGPFNVLAGVEESNRFFRGSHPCEAPELCTVFTRPFTVWQAGYWVDDPAERPSWIVSFYGDEGYEPSVCGRSLFDLMRDRLEARVANLDEEEADRLPVLDALRERLVEHATAEHPERGAEHVARCYFDDAVLERRAIVAALTFEGVGIVVPKETYVRPPWFAGSMRGLLESATGLATVERAAQKALESGHFGTALELGKALWAWNPEARRASYPIVQRAYRALGRPLLAEVVDAHREAT